MTIHRIGLVSVILAAACSSSPGTIGGVGTQTLFVEARCELEGGDTHVRVTVRRANVAVTDAVVTMRNEIAPAITVPHQMDGTYRGTIAGYRGTCQLDVTAGGDSVGGAAVLLPDRPELSSARSFDARAQEKVTLTWSGTRSDRIEVRSRDFESGEIPDRGYLEVPSTAFVESPQEIRLRRENKVALTGGVQGSDLAAIAETRTDVTVMNPYPR